jgi:hypothetical protein
MVGSCISYRRHSETLPIAFFVFAVLRASSRLLELYVYTPIEVDALHSIRRDVVATVLTRNRISTSPSVLGIAESGVRSRH